MKTLIACLTLLSLTSISYAQVEVDSIQFNLAFEKYNEEKIDSALLIFKQLAHKVDTGEVNTFAQIAYFNVADIYYRQADSVNAKVWLLKILKSKLNDQLDIGGLMDPMANFKHKSCLKLARIAEMSKNIPEMIRYIELSENKYPYYGFPGSATNLFKHDSWLSNWKYDLLKESNQIEKAIEYGMTSVLVSDYSDTHDKLLEKLALDIKKNYKKKQFIKAFKNALNSISQNEEGFFELSFLDFNIEIKPKEMYLANNANWLKYEKYDKDKMTDFLKKNEFYQKIIEGK